MKALTQKVIGVLITTSLIGVSFPVFSFAQTTDSEEFTIPEEEYSYSRNSSTNSKVGQLPTIAVQNVPIPVLFGVPLSKITDTFGDPRSGGRTHEGNDIIAPKGTPIVSPTESVVIGIGVWTGAGNYVSTANPGGENFRYMHLDRVANIKVVYKTT